MGRDVKTAPIDRAALLILRQLVTDLEAGAAVIVSLQAEDDQERAFALRWRDSGREPGAVTSPKPRDALCQQCGEPVWAGQHGSVCPACGALAP